MAAGAPALNEGWAEALSFEHTTVHVFYGPLSGTRGPSDADVNVVSDVGDMLGAQLAVAGDMDADGLPDLLVSGPGDDEGGADAGAVWLLSGAMLAQGRRGPLHPGLWDPRHTPLERGQIRGYSQA